MTASELLRNLESRGVTVRADGDNLKLDAPLGVMTSADYGALRAVKPELIALLTQPPPGSIRRPVTVRGARLKACPFPDCAGAMSNKGNIYLCGECGLYFELLPLEGSY